MWHCWRARATGNASTKHPANWSRTRVRCGYMSTSGFTNRGIIIYPAAIRSRTGTSHDIAHLAVAEDDRTPEKQGAKNMPEGDRSSASWEKEVGVCNQRRQISGRHGLGAARPGARP